MPTNYPNSLDTFPSSSTLATHSLSTDPHSVLHGNLGDALSALEIKVGINSSTVTSSLDYKVSHLLTRQVTAGSGLSGGGDLSSDVTLSLPNIGTANTYGDSTHYPIITTDSQGRVNSVTTQLVQGGVSSFNTRTGAITLTTTDVDSALPADVVQTDITNTFTVGPQTIQTGGDGNKGLLVKGNSGSQSANLQEWQDSTGAILGYVRNDGSVSVPALTAVNIYTVGGPILSSLGVALSSGNEFYWPGTDLTDEGVNGRLRLLGFGSAVNTQFIIRAVPAQSANLQEWQSSVGVLTSVDPEGTIRIGTGGNIVFSKSGRGISFVANPLTDAADLDHAIYGSPDGTLNLAANGASVLFLMNDGGTGAPGIDVRAFTGTTSTPVTALRIKTHAGGVAEAGLGGRIHFQSSSSTTNYRDQGTLDCTWADATDATRKGRITLNVFDTVLRECLRGEANGTSPMIGFLGANAVTRPTVTGSRGGNAALASLLSALANLGLITDSST